MLNTDQIVLKPNVVSVRCEGKKKIKKKSKAETRSEQFGSALKTGSALTGPVVGTMCKEVLASREGSGAAARSDNRTDDPGSASRLYRTKAGERGAIVCPHVA